MRTRVTLFLSFFLLVSISQLFAQLNITYPSSRAVFQRDQANNATIYIAGYVTGNPTSIEARLIPRTTDGVTSIPAESGWQVISTSLQLGNFYGNLTASGGWYQLEVRSKSGTTITFSSTVDRVGIGEVFIVAGQSNATGSNELPSGPGATDDRVNSVDFQNYNPLNDPAIQPYSNVQMPYPIYTHLASATRLAPFGNNAWNWGQFGDYLVAKLGVPVMIFNTGWTATSSQNWRESIDPNFQTVNGFGYHFPAGLPFGHLRLALNYYASILGARAILWHQGESDNLDSKSREEYRTNLTQVIQASRTVSNKPNLAWVIARASRYTIDGVSRIWAPVIDAQNDLLGIPTETSAKVPYTFPGPATDDAISEDLRRDGVHFEGDGLRWLGEQWSNAISTDFLNNSVPYPAAAPHHVQLAGNTTDANITLTAPSDYPSYQWTTLGDFTSTLSSSQSFNSSEDGTFLVLSKDAQNNVVISPEVKVAMESLPVTLVAFQGTAVESANQLAWSTTSESASSHFEVQSSNDGTHFSTIGKVSSAGESSVLENYYFLDENVYNTLTYYRLKAVDLDGTYTYSSMLSVYNMLATTPKVYPNPFKTNLKITHNAPIDLVTITDLAGSERIFKGNGKYTMELPVADLPAGMYLVKVGNRTYKVVKP